jgi:hypothetical protein
MSDYNKLELEFYLNTALNNCSIINELDDSNNSKTLIHLYDTQSINVVGYQCWSADTITINNKGPRRFFVKTINDFIAMIDKYNKSVSENFNNDERNFTPSCVLKTNDGSVYYLIIESFELKNERNLNENAVENVLTLVANNYFINKHTNKLGEYVEKVPNGDYTNLDLFFSGFTVGDMNLDEESKHLFPDSAYFGSGLPKHNNYPIRKKGILNNLSLDEDKSLSALDTHNYIINEQSCKIQNLPEKNNKIQIEILSPKMITKYEDWSKTTSYKKKSSNRSISCITPAMFVSHIHDFNENHMSIDQNDVNIPFNMFWFKPTAIIEVQNKKILAVIERFEIQKIQDENESELLVITISKNKMEYVSPDGSVEVQSIELNDSTGYNEHIFMNIDPDVSKENVNPKDLLEYFQILGLDFLSFLPLRKVKRFMGIPVGIDWDFTNPETNYFDISQSVESPDNYNIMIDASQLFENAFQIVANTSNSDYVAEYNTMAIKTMKAHRYTLNTSTKYDVPLFIDIVVDHAADFDIAVNIYDNSFKKISRVTESQYGYRLSGMNQYIIEITGGVSDGLANDLTLEKSGQYTLTIQPSNGESFLPTPEMGVTSLDIKELEGRNYFNTVTLKNKGFGIGITGNPAKRYYLTVPDSNAETLYTYFYNKTFKGIQMSIIEINQPHSENNPLTTLTKWPWFWAAPQQLVKFKQYFIEVSCQPGKWNVADNYEQTFDIYVGNGKASSDPTQPSNLLPIRNSYPLINRRPTSKFITTKSPVTKLVRENKRNKMRLEQNDVTVGEQQEILINGSPEPNFSRGIFYNLILSNDLINSDLVICHNLTTL